MPDHLYLDPDSPDAGAAVIKVGGQCYTKVGDSDEPIDTSDADDTYDTCADCAAPTAPCDCAAAGQTISGSGTTQTDAGPSTFTFSILIGPFDGSGYEFDSHSSPEYYVTAANGKAIHVNGALGCPGTDGHWQLVIGTVENPGGQTDPTEIYHTQYPYFTIETGTVYICESGNLTGNGSESGITYGDPFIPSISWVIS